MAMRYRLVDEKPKTFVLVFETNDELAQALKAFASEQRLASASFKAIGALSSVSLGWLNWETKKHEPSVSLHEQLELLSLIGDIPLKDGEPQVHAHAVVGKRDGTAWWTPIASPRSSDLRIGVNGEPGALEKRIRSGRRHCADQAVVSELSDGETPKTMIVTGEFALPRSARDRSAGRCSVGIEATRTSYLKGDFADKPLFAPLQASFTL
jgi:uncharacterized protein